jgi:RecA-family ATPase
LADADVPGLHVLGADLAAISLLHLKGTQVGLADVGWNRLQAELDQVRPDVLVIDPLISVMGGANPNDNAAAALLMGRLVALAAERRMAIMLAHHAAKGRDPTSAEGAMGAASFVNLARIALGIEPLAQADADKVGLPPGS